jgi:transglutaminase-like putative cysteine protease
MLRKICVSLSLFLAFTSAASAQESRHFTFHYAFTVKNLPPGEKVRIWFPEAHTDAYQEIKNVKLKGDLPLRGVDESKYRNRILYAETSSSPKPELHFEVEYEVIRHERVALYPSPERVSDTLSPKDKRLGLEPNALVPITGLPAELAAKVTSGKTDPLEKARAIYDYVFTTMRYDKTGTGWGHGDVLYACDVKKGNCTDFHSLFIAMARSQGIPARFEIGFPLPADKHSAEIAGYHCWADFYIDGREWIPVDISEAWKHPEKRDYFFGSHDVNRMQFSTGRDLRLNPGQDGKPLNYFVYPYVEVDGHEFANVDLAFSFADAEAAVVAK